MKSLHFFFVSVQSAINTKFNFFFIILLPAEYVKRKLAQKERMYETILPILLHIRSRYSASSTILHCDDMSNIFENNI